MSIKADSATDYLTCEVQFNAQGVILDFQPEPGNKHTEQAYESKVANLRPASAGQASGQVPSLVNGTFKRKDHVRGVSKDRPTRMAFLLDPLSTWRFTAKGFAPKIAIHQARFQSVTVAPSGKVVEVTFTPEGQDDEYAYELWLQADVLTPQGSPPGDRPSVTIIVDPIVKGTSIPP
jgi:hypothetical protein